MSKGLVVVGGGPAGHSAATAYRSAGGGGPVTIISSDSAAPYNRPPLSKDFLRAESGEDELPLESDTFYGEQGIELQLQQRVVALDVRHRTVRTNTGSVLRYDACVLATGSQPSNLPVPGGNDPRVLRLRFLDQARTLRAAAERAESAVVVGSGFIGCEAAVSLASRGLAVTMVSTEELPQLARLGREAAQQIGGWLTGAGVRQVSGARVSSFVDGHLVRLEDGRELAADLVLTAVGIVPQSQLAAAVGVAIENDRIVVDQHMQTSAPGLFAAGDVAHAWNAAVGRALDVEHWGEAMAMGEVAGTRAAGGDASWAEVPGFWTELGERTLKYAAWGDGFEEARFVQGGDVKGADVKGGDGFTVWYGTGGVTVGVLTYEADDDYDRGMSLVEQGAPLPES